MSIFFDKYTIRARFAPVAIVLIPLAFIINIYFPILTYPLKNISIISLTLIIFLFLLSDFLRRCGKSVESEIFTSMGAAPSVIILRQRDKTISKSEKNRYLKFLSSKINEPIPTIEDEFSQPKACDAFYDSCCTWLRENTRDKQKYNILLEENINYGFIRNLYGIRTFVFLIDFLILLFLIIILLNHPCIISRNSTYSDILLALIITTIHLFSTTLFVTKNAVEKSARRYALQLIRSCNILMS